LAMIAMSASFRRVARKFSDREVSMGRSLVMSEHTPDQISTFQGREGAAVD
jgi:hypothetical protein